MKQSTLEITYHIALTILLVVLAYSRIDYITGPNPTTFDVVLILMIALLFLLPLGKEVSVGGFSVKRELEKVKDEIVQKISILRTDIASSIAVSPTFNLGMPFSDESLKEFEKRVTQIVNEAYSKVSPAKPEIPTELSLDKDTYYLFAARYVIEKEIRRIWESHGFMLDVPQPRTVDQMITNLAAHALLPEGFNHAIRAVYTAASSAVHGIRPSDAKVIFVRDLAPKVIATLQGIK